MLATVQTAILGGMPYTALRDAIFTHPTMAEGLNSLFAGVPAEPESAGRQPREKENTAGSAAQADSGGARALRPRQMTAGSKHS